MVKTLAEIIAARWLATGGKGEPTREFTKRWREENFEYGKWPLGTLFRSGNSLPVGLKTSLDLATAEWVRTGRPMPPRGPEFEALAEAYHCEDRATEPAAVTAKRAANEAAQQAWRRQQAQFDDTDDEPEDVDELVES